MQKKLHNSNGIDRVVRFLFLFIMPYVLSCSRTQIPEDFGVAGLLPVYRLPANQKLDMEWGDSLHGLMLGIMPAYQVIDKGEAVYLICGICCITNDYFYVLPPVVSERKKDLLNITLIGPHGQVHYSGEYYCYPLAMKLIKMGETHCFLIKLNPLYWNISTPGKYCYKISYKQKNSSTEDRRIWQGLIESQRGIFVVRETELITEGTLIQSGSQETNYVDYSHSFSLNQEQRIKRP